MLILPQTPLLSQYDNRKLKLKTSETEKQTDMKMIISIEKLVRIQQKYRYKMIILTPF